MLIILTVLKRRTAAYLNVFAPRYNSINAQHPLRSMSLFTDQNVKNAIYNGSRSIFGVAVTSKIGCMKKMHCTMMFSSLILLSSIFTLIKKSKQEAAKFQVTGPIRILVAMCKVLCIYCKYIMFHHRSLLQCSYV